MTASALPDGFVVRTPTYTDDGIAELDAVVALLAACDIAVVGEADTGRDAILSRSGANCQLSSLRQLVEADD